MNDLDDLILDLANFANKPYSFVMWAFPWGEEGTDLRNATGPEPWQRKILMDLEQGLITANEAIRLAIKSGHGIGKSALVAWIILWAFSTFEDTRGVVTANTETQLKTKTWVELATWFRRFIARDLFKLTATALYSNDPERERTWRFDMVPWSERNTEAFAGLHNKGKRILLVMDEASAIPDLIWEVAEGALTDVDTEIIWLACGNPTRNRGRFRDCFPGGKFNNRWKTITVDSREVSFTNKTQVESWVEDYGEDSDFIRIRVKGEFPRIDSESFISRILAEQALGRVVEPQHGFPLLLGVDVARFGDDLSVIYPRRGRDASTWKPQIFQGLDTMQLASKVADQFWQLHADLCLVDGGGLGAGVVDRLRQLRVPVFEVQFGSSPDGLNTYERAIKYANKRSEIWGEMRDWLQDGSIASISIPQVNGSAITLVDELTAPVYGMTDKEVIQLERKRDMRRRGVLSPDVADALACTFALPSVRARTVPLLADYSTPVPDYDPFDLQRIYAQ